MSTLAIIGGSGVTSLKGLEIKHRQVVHTPYGAPSAALIFGQYHNHDIVFLPRHGQNHSIPPHQINYRANLWALHQVGIKSVIAIAAVGSMQTAMQTGHIVIPHQLIDYTWGRAHTFFESNKNNTAAVTHIDFSAPYSPHLRDILIKAGTDNTTTVHPKGVYAATQGPRLETAAEIQRLMNDGCDIVGMTGMPEAALARELELYYACCALVVNPAAGLNTGEISMQDIEKQLKSGVEHVRQLLADVISHL